ncbi:MAG: SDR family oxidoreductase [Alphaproteobacteria bacterium]|nr:MAG: SDR family oxidoreductase [Alphaproteobacteria bacterium]
MTYQPFDLTGKVALVTGGNGGIGLGMAEALAAAGADLMIWGTNEDKNAKALEKLKAHGVKAEAMKVDVADEDAVRASMKETVEKMGRIDTAVANAGIGFGAPSFLELDGEKMNKVFSVNLNGALYTLREAARHMVERASEGDPGGSLVGISSLSAISGAARNEHYAATKGGLISAIKGIAVEFARYGVTANAVLPGWIATDMTSAAQGSDVFQTKVITRVPMRRWGEPSDFGGIAVYLASDAAKFHTGDSFVIDGGYAVF